MTTRTTPDFVAGMRFAATIVARMKARVNEADPLFATTKMTYGLVIGTLNEQADAVESEVIAALQRAPKPTEAAHGEAEAGYE
jgi:hypothetical protein